MCFFNLDLFHDVNIFHSLSSRSKCSFLWAVGSFLVRCRSSWCSVWHTESPACFSASPCGFGEHKYRAKVVCTLKTNKHIPTTINIQQYSEVSVRSDGEIRSRTRVTTVRRRRNHSMAPSHCERSEVSTDSNTWNNSSNQKLRHVDEML